MSETTITMSETLVKMWRDIDGDVKDTDFRGVADVRCGANFKGGDDVGGCGEMMPRDGVAFRGHDCRGDGDDCRGW